ncbi:GHKL domain-containing protein [Peribacillus cavernae]|uniref:histidine kinase n=1 Tax=Peribacillus cavernae TaxID=1674310 RepID=A0A3S0V743_9BACI|nr:histidine kinase N-terminal domain-containing protein [Peribacillus cavernae]MDQ0219940.1 signal transduction histidine kinase [Peribacillus cavernae]RUQ24251.1 GHKL domain-containing protein [Peribacillus cavernae]
MVLLKETVAEFLLQHKSTILTEWTDRILASDRNISQDNITQHVEALFGLVIQGLMDSSIDESIRSLSQIVAAEILNSNADIADFLVNTSLGRTVINGQLTEWIDNVFENYKVFQSINDCFDKFIYHTVSHHSELKSRMAEDQYSFLNQTHKDRLTLLGRMTSSFVHEFRNPLTSIMGFIQLLQAEHQGLKYLQIISRELEQLNDRITQFLHLSKKEWTDSEADIFSLKDLVNEVIEFLYPSILEVNASISCNIIGDILIRGSKEEFRQVLLNIILNALDVISDVGYPSIYICASEKPTGYMTLNIANNGPKIPEEIIPNIFDPFITTKKSGTGLGLFVCKEIIEKHHGTLSCSSSDALTTFSIFAPCS